MKVIIDGKEVEREVDYVERRKGELPREIPVLRPDEKLVEVLYGPPVIVKAPTL